MSLQPLKVLQVAIRAVPSLKYALGVVGLVAAVAVVKAFGVSPAAAVFGAIITLVLMVALVIFAKLTTTAPKHFLVPVLVLMWSFLVLAIATGCLLFSSAFFRWPIELPGIVPTRKSGSVVHPIDTLLGAARAQRNARDYAGAWKVLQQALEIQPESAEAQQEQIQLAMIWLRNMSVESSTSFAAVVDSLLPCLYQGAVKATGSQAADILAHIGWGNYLKSRDGARDLQIEAEYQQAVKDDPDNPYAHAMWGHWILSNRGKVSEARPHFAAALKTGRDRAFVRELQIAALLSNFTPEAVVEKVRVADEMRKNQEPLSQPERERLCRSIYYSSRDEVLAQLSAIPSPAEHLATFLWLADQEQIRRSPTYGFFLARLTEATGDYSKALSIYLSIDREAGLEKQVEEGIARCRQKDPQGKSALQVLTESAQDKDPVVRQQAMRSLLKVRGDAAQVAPMLIAGIKDENQEVRLAAREGLAELRVAAVPALIELLGSKEPRDVKNAATALGQIGPAAKPAVPALDRLLRSENEQVRSAAISTLAEIGEEAEAAIPSLLEVLKHDRDPDLRRLAGYALGEIGPAAKDAVPALMEMLQDKSPDDRFRGRTAVEALGKIGPAAKAAVPALMEALDDPGVSTWASDALGKIGADAKIAIPAMIEALRGGGQVFQANCAEDLGRIAQSLAERGDTQAIPALKKAVRAMEGERLEAKAMAPVKEALETLQEQARSK